MELPIIKELKKELVALKHEMNHVLPQQLEEARAHGDLSENAEWEAAKDRQGLVKARIGALEGRIAELSMYTLSSIPTGVAGYGSRVTVEDTDAGEEIIYRLVFGEEADVKNGDISMTSPLGKALMGRTVGAEVEVVTPGGKKFFEVVEVETLHQILGAAES